MLLAIGVLGLLVVVVAVLVLTRGPWPWRGAARKREFPARPETPIEDAARQRGRRLSGEYRPLYDYLECRYADTVVLTFEQIENLLGFTLPDRSRSDGEWWTAPGAAEPCHSNAWALAPRTAIPNLPARIVVFERVPG